ncbi:MAG: hypothetical protein E6293_02540 [Dialister sp.]|nr:hypothetical protein [Dialister sp.]
MNELKVGNRVRIISDPKFIEFTGEKSIIGMTGTVKELNETCVGVEFDVCMGGHNGSWDGKPGYCWYIPYERLEKIEETKEEETKEEVNEETKADTLEQKILEVLREEIGVEIGEEFDVYENGKKQWTCKFEEDGFLDEINGKFRESGLWKQIVCKFHRYQFKKKPFIPQEHESYWHVDIMHSGNLGESLGVRESVWVGILFNYGNLALGNVFRTKEEALENKDKLLERLNELLKGE